MANSRYVFTFWLQPNVPAPSPYFTDQLGKAPAKPAGDLGRSAGNAAFWTQDVVFSDPRALDSTPNSVYAVF